MEQAPCEIVLTFNAEIPNAIWRRGAQQQRRRRIETASWVASAEVGQRL